jgi:hypothetical protein
VIKLRGMRWVGHVARVRERRGSLCGYLREREHLEDLDLGGNLIFKFDFKT